MATGSETINVNLTVPTGWDKLDDHQLRYVFGLLGQGFPSPQVKTYCLFRWTGMQVMHKYGKGWWCKFADDEFVIMAEQINSAIAALDWINQLPPKPVRISRIDKHRALTADFQEVPFETFIICDNLYQGYLSVKEDALGTHRRVLLVCLTQGDVRPSVQTLLQAHQQRRRCRWQYV